MSTPAGGPGGSSTPPAAQSEAEVALSAERVEVAVHRLPRERVRLRREIHTRQVEVTVSVRREVLRIERLRFEDGDVDTPTAVPTDQAPLEITLHEERPVVQVEAVPYERVRVAVDRIPLTARVDTTAQHEVVDVVTQPSDTATASLVPTGTPLRASRTS